MPQFATERNVPGAGSPVADEGARKRGYNHKSSLKQVARHCLHTCGMSEVVKIIQQRRGTKTGHIGKTRPEAFSEIYDTSAWGAHGGETLSGLGSTNASTVEIVQALSMLLTQFDLGRIVDIGCGDFNWMQHVVGDREYIGIDIVPLVIQSNRERFGTNKRHFIVADVVESPLPSGDVAICREVLFHLSFADAKRLLSNIAKTAYRHVILTTDTDIWFNSDINSGDFRPLNLYKRPFNLPNAVIEVSDNKVSSGRVLGLWRGDQVAVKT